ncbi:MAG: hypothetical protein KC486_02010 [Myxococcales bacterium]|nr:hypothetical protein [Myxococcales bacterium]
MAELGSIYEEDPRSGARGRDLRVEVRYPSWALGDADGAWVEVADELPVDGEAVARTPSAFDRPGQVLVRLPENFPENGCLRLRGQGETPAGGGPPGDLFVQISLDRDAKRPAGRIAGAAAGLPALPTGGPPLAVILAVAAGGVAILYWAAVSL